MSITAYFPTFIYETNLEYDNSMLYDKAISLREKDASVNTHWFCDTYNSIGKYDITKDAQFESLVKSCIDHVKIFSKEYGIFNPVIHSNDGWVNVAMKGEYQEFHIHPNNHFSLVYYVSVPENSGNLIFRSPESATDMFMLPSGKETLGTMKTATIKPSNGKLVIFRSNLLHMVEKNKNESPRVSVSMNVVLQ